MLSRLIVLHSDFNIGFSIKSVPIDEYFEKIFSDTVRLTFIYVILFP